MSNTTTALTKNQPTNNDIIIAMDSIMQPNTYGIDAMSSADIDEFFSTSLQDFNIKIQSQKKKTTRKKVVERKPIDIKPWDDVQFTRQGDIYGELLYMSRGVSHGATIRRLDADRYQVVKTGEIRYFNSDHQVKVKDNLMKTFRELVGILRSNFKAGEKNQVFLTLTFQDNITDPEELYYCYDLFIKNLRYAYKDHKLDYVAIAEPQARGAWHMHVFLKSDKDYLYISNRKLTVYVTDPDNPKKRLKDDKGRDIIDYKKSIWPHGSTTSERLKGDDAGQYYISYFTSIIVGAENCDEHAIVKQKGQKGLKQSKRVEKGARIPMYPKFFKLFRCSRGIIRPEKEVVKYEDVTSEYDKKTKTRTIDIMDGDNVLNTMQFESFKKINKNKKDEENEKTDKPSPPNPDIT